MIKNILLPEKIHNYYLFPKRVVGIDLGKTQVTASYLYYQGRTVVLEKVITQTLPAGTTTDYQERVTRALAMVLNKKNYDEIHTALSSSLLFFKELVFPFIKREQISQVIEFEMEKLLPFPLDSAIIDFIITKTESTQSTVMIAAAQKHHIAEHLALFEAAGIIPDVITVDLFSLYGLVHRRQSYNHENLVLVDFGFSGTRLAFIEQGQLTFIRSLPMGISMLLKKISTDSSITAQQALEDLIRFGVENHDNKPFHHSLLQVLHEWADTLGLTITSRQSADKSPFKIALLGGGALIKDIASFVQQQLAREVFILGHDKTLLPDTREKTITPTMVLSIATACDHESIQDFNFRKKEFSAHNDTIFVKQIATAGVLLLLLFTILIAHSLNQTRRLSNAFKQADKQVRTTLQQTLELTSARNLDDLVEEAQRKVDDQERIWSAFSRQTRASFLAYLQKLSARIDKHSLGLNLKKLMFKQELIQLQGEVTSIDALKVLEEALEQTNLGYISKSEEPKFTITITLKKLGDNE
jgi:type IV pilus assembly protein PilM